MYPFSISVEVIFRDIDSFGHVNNAVYFTYLETARTKYFRKIKTLAGIDKLDMVVAQATCNYITPAYIDEKLIVSIGITRLGDKSFDFAYKIQSEKGYNIAEAKTVQVTYDYKNSKTIKVPEQFKSTVMRLQNGLHFPTN
ncbi:MAG TPA: acyl-CoA thioesterase [Chloroflexi bacterium]|nr:acyl-CoA thioesterase [Chloroflexota bacterium]